MKYAKTHIAFHWITALMIVFMAASGLAYSYDIIDKPALAAHQIAGQVLILLLVGRIVARLLIRTASSETTHHRVERAAAVLTHIGLYLCLIAFSVTGYVSASALSSSALLFPVDIGFARSETGERLLEAHFMLKWVLLGLLSLHLAGVIKHVLIDRDGTFAHMTTPIRKD